MTDALPPGYHGSGPVFPGEDAHQAAALNAAHSLSAHLLARRSPSYTRGMNYAPGDGLEHEPPDDAASIRAARPAPGHSPASDLDDMEEAHDDHDINWSRAMRQDSGYVAYEGLRDSGKAPSRAPNPAWRAPRTPTTRRGPGTSGTSRP